MAVPGRPERGVFIALEGIDGSGKSTIAQRLADAVRASGRAALLTREPGGTAVGERIRDILLSADAATMGPATEALLFTAARAQLIAEVIRPALSRGDVVITDRFVDSSLAYQGGGRGLDRDAIKAAQSLATGGLEPDLKILLDLPVEVAQSRRLSDEASANRLDREVRGFHDRVSEAYRALAMAEPARWRVVDASRGREDVWNDVWREVVASGLLDLASSVGVSRQHDLGPS